MKHVLIAALLSCLAVSPAHAHGGKHVARQAFDPATAEQKDFGIAADPGKATRTIKVTVADSMRFSPSKITIRQGEIVNIVVTNHGKLAHEMVIGTRKDLQEHAELMKKFPDMEHDEPHMAHVQPGRSEQIVWRFNRPGEFNFACLVAGHYEAGMAGKIIVLGKDRPAHDAQGKE